MRSLKIRYVLTFAFLLSAILAFAQETFNKAIPDKPSKPALVNDLGSMLNDSEEALLEEKLYQFERETSNEIAVVTVETLDGLEVSDFANQLGRKWDIGKEKKKNGVLLLISKTDRKLNISPGYGLQGALPDVICSRIIRDYIVPRFRAGEVYLGIDEGTTAIMSATKGEFTADESPAMTIGPLTLFILLLFFLIFMMVFFYIIRNRKSIYVSRRGYKYDDDHWGGGGFGGGFFGGGSGWGGGSSGGGGGFGGFGGGGGGFDGGGASGSW